MWRGDVRCRRVSLALRTSTDHCSSRQKHTTLYRQVTDLSLNVFHADVEQRHMTPSRINHMMTTQEFADVTAFVSKQIDGADGYLPLSLHPSVRKCRGEHR